jgi:crotonobetainyl-CoA:carnitine CoA-transferase CaiB-like acyl-CoA transferase
MTTSPLSGITILDLTRVLSGPYCTMLAADMGARVIKVEHPERGDDTRAWGPPFQGTESSYYLSVNRNKEGIAVDFKKPEGRAILHALAAKADVLVENFRPGTLDPIGLGYEELAAKHPSLIYVSISGFGQNGPRRDEASPARKMDRRCGSAWPWPTSLPVCSPFRDCWPRSSRAGAQAADSASTSACSIQSPRF